MNVLSFVAVVLRLSSMGKSKACGWSDHLFDDFHCELQLQGFPNSTQTRSCSFFLCMASIFVSVLCPKLLHPTWFLLRNQNAEPATTNNDITCLSVAASKMNRAKFNRYFSLSSFQYFKVFTAQPIKAQSVVRWTKSIELSENHVCFFHFYFENFSRRG